MVAAVVSGRYAPPILQLAKHVFYFMPLFIQGFVIRDLTFPVFLRGNAGRYPLFQQAIPEPISVITAICKKMFGCGEVAKQLSGTLIIRHLTGRQIHEHRFAKSVANGV